MADALQYLYYIFSSFTDTVFNYFSVSDNVSIGWILVSIFIFTIMIQSILNLPRGVNLRKDKK